MKPISNPLARPGLLEQLLTGSSLSPIPALTKASSSAPRRTMVIVNMEASGTFLSNVAVVLTATGMTLEELFAYLAEAATAHQFDRFVQSPLVNGRFPDVEAQTITGLLGGLTEQLIRETSGISDTIGEFKLLKVDELDDSAILEIAPTTMGTKRNSSDSTHPLRRPKAPVRGTVGTVKGSNLVRIKRSGVE
ncbi:hypothetical protein D9M68_20100 [compost metagenome]